MKDCQFCQNQRELHGFDWDLQIPITNACPYCKAVRILGLKEIEAGRRRLRLAEKAAVQAAVDFRKEIQQARKRNVKR